MTPYPNGALALLLICTLWAGPSAGAQTVRQVPRDHPTIQQALDAAAEGDTVRVARGSYDERLTLKAGVVVQGEETAETFLTGTVGGSGGTVERFTVQDPAWSFRRADGLVIRNCVFTGAIGVAVNLENSTNSEIANNVFYDNGTALRFSNIDGVFSSGTVLANAFVDNGTALVAPMEAVTKDYNLFFGNEEDGTTGSSPLAAAPGFVDAPGGDFHLVEDANSIDVVPAEILADPDGTAADGGAYGGPRQDPKPRQVQALLVTAGLAANTVALTWAASADYRVTGYQVHYGTASGVYTGTGAAEGDSPVTVPGGTTSGTSLSDLTVSATAPAAPPGLSTSPEDQGLYLAWATSAGATGYIAQYGTETGVYTQEQDVGDATELRLGGLTNGVTYYLAVRPYTATTYYFAVNALGTPPAGTEASPAGRLSSEQTFTLLKTLGKLSAEATETPAAISGYPALSDSGLCFLGTLPGSSVSRLGRVGLGALLLVTALARVRRRLAVAVALASLVVVAGNARAADAPHWSVDARAGASWPSASKWNDHYDRRTVPELKLSVGYRPILQLEFGAEAGYRRAEGSVDTTDSGTALSRALDQTLTVIPLGAYALVRWQTTANPLLVPYLAAGLTRALYRHEVDGGSNADGHQDGYHARAGLRLSLWPFDPRAAQRSQSQYGLDESALTLEAQYARLDDFGGADTDLGAWTLFAGLGFGF